MKTLLVEGDKTFKIDIPDDSKITFGPWAPPNAKYASSEFRADPEKRKGTLRIYSADGKNVIAVFSPVSSFRDLSLVGYSEMVAREEGASIWKSDRDGYQREDKVSRAQEWVDPHKQLPAPKKVVAKSKK